MRLGMKRMIFSLAIAVAAGANTLAQTSDLQPSTDEVVAKMMEADAVRQSHMAGYTAFQVYIAVNGERRAEMRVRVDCSFDGVKQFTVLSEDGSGSIRKHVFSKMLREEGDASRGEARENSRITPANYEFRMVGQETLESGPAYVLAISPKNDSKYLMAARIWVDAQDYSIVRIEGRPARNPSFWVHDVHFVHTYQRVGPFWLAFTTESTSEVRIFGPSKLTIESSDYVLHPPPQQSLEPVSIAGVMR